MCVCVFVCVVYVYVHAQVVKIGAKMLSDMKEQVNHLVANWLPLCHV